MPVWTTIMTRVWCFRCVWYLFSRRSHARLDYDNGPSDVFLLHPLAVHLNGLDAHFHLLWWTQYTQISTHKTFSVTRTHLERTRTSGRWGRHCVPPARWGPSVWVDPRWVGLQTDLWTRPRSGPARLGSPDILDRGRATTLTWGMMQRSILDFKRPLYHLWMNTITW